MYANNVLRATLAKMVKQYAVTYPTTFVSQKTWNIAERVTDQTGDVNNVMLLESVCSAPLNTSAPHSGRYRSRSNAKHRTL